MSRRIPTYGEGYGFDFWNMVSTIGAFTIAVAMLVFAFNIVRSAKRRHDQPAPGPDPWDARSLEWSVPSPTPEHNFDDDPVVTKLDDFWHRKYQEDEETGEVRQVATGAEVAMPGDPSRAHLPAPSYWPIVLALGFPVIGYGLIFNLVLAAVGGALVLGGFVGWALEPPDDEDLPPHGHDHPAGDDGHAADATPDAVEEAPAATDADAPKEEVTVDG